MNLKFDVLWFDDSADEFFDSLDFEAFDTAVRSWGFIPRIELVKTPAEFTKEAPFRAYDLIVVDYNLGDDVPHGESFIKQVRDHQVYTEIIFYTAQAGSDLWEAISKTQLEGIYVANRSGILNKLVKVAQQAVHKVLDLDNMRGVVMAEVGEIDHILDAILKIGVTGLSSAHQTEFFDRFQERALKQAEATCEKLRKFKAEPTCESMTQFCDSYKRWVAFKGLIKRHAIVKDVRLDDYNADVIARRNHLAHGAPRLMDHGYIFQYEDEEYVFDEKESLSLRRTILEYKAKFQTILSGLSNGAT